MQIKYFLLVLSALICLTPTRPSYAIGWFGRDLDGELCEGKAQGYGPFDYTDPEGRKHLTIVESYHFTHQVQRLSKSPRMLIPDLDYTLRAFPNHHPALYALIRLEEKASINRDDSFAEIETKPECYLLRAERYSPKDPNVQLLFGLYLQKKGKLDLARKKYEKGIELQPNSAEGHYNLGLLLVDMGQFEDARKHASLAYKIGYPLPGLRNKLARAGYPLFGTEQTGRR